MAKAQGGGGRAGGGGHPLMTGVIVGVLIGLCVALALALYLTKANPFVGKSGPTDVSKKEGRAEPEKPVPGLPTGNGKAANATPGDGKNGERRFEFYDILPKSGEGTPERKPGEQATSRHQVYFLQAGSFQKSSDADNLKARLALAGLEARIVSATVGDSVWHRVRLGPFDTETAMNEARSVLQENRIEAKVIKSAQNTRD